MELASAYGLEADEWQADVLEAWLGRDGAGRWTAKECGLMVPRQNGKNAVLEMRELYGAAVLGERILHTAHQVKTAREAFMRICSYFDNPQDFPELSELVRDIRRTNGQEAVELANGGAVRFVARSRSSARGFTADVLVLDEAQELTDEQIEALQPTLSAAPTKNSQVIMTGTPPGPMAPGEVLAKWRGKALQSPSPIMAWHEWSVAEAGDVADVSRWYEANPALGSRITLAAVRSELETLSEDGFARERLGHWSDAGPRKVVAPGEWDALAVEAGDVPAEGKLAYGVKFSPDGQSVSLAVAIQAAGGRVHVECVEHRSQKNAAAWLAGWLAARAQGACGIAIDGKSGAGALAEALDRAGVRKKLVVQASTRDVTTASAMMLDAIHEKSVTHFAQPLLTEAVHAAHRRRINSDGGWGWGGGGGVDVSPIEAASLAHWCVLTSKRDPTRKQRLL